MHKARLANQFLFVCLFVPLFCVNLGLAVEKLGWCEKFFNWEKRTVGCKSHPEGLCSFLMYHWIWALKVLKHHWAFCACSQNGLCKVLNCVLNFPCTLILSLSHLRLDIGDDPSILTSGHFKWRLFQLFHLSISLKSDSPTVAQCEAVIVRVSFCPMRSLVFCIWKDPERRCDCWINTQTAFCLLHFGFCYHETQRRRHADNQWGRGAGGRVLGFCLNLFLSSICNF